MIADNDRVVLPEGVSVGVGYLEDVVRGCCWPLNDTGGFVLGRLGTQLRAVVQDLADTYSLPLEVARRDVLQFIWMLNAVAVVNIVQDGSRLRRWRDWLALTVRLLPAAALPAPVTTRRALDTRTVPRAVASVLRASASRVLSVSSAAATALLPLVAVLGGGGTTAVVSLGLAAGTGVGVGLHEAGHVVTLRGVPSALVLRGRRTFVLHAPLGETRRSLVAFSGPATAVAFGLGADRRGESARLAPARGPRPSARRAHRLALDARGGWEVRMRDLKAFFLGAVTVGILAYAAAASLAVATQAAGGSLRLGVGPIIVVSVEREISAASTTFGSGLLLLALVGGLLNLAAARIVRRKAEGRSRDVD